MQVSSLPFVMIDPTLFDFIHVLYVYDRRLIEYNEVRKSE
jgi:hypothetical protein